MSHLERSGEFDLPRISSYPWLNDFVFLAETDSTNDVALARSADRGSPTPLLVLAQRQTRGRGRGSNRWWAGDGALTFSLLIDAHHIPVPSAEWPRLPLFTGLAVARALQQSVPADLVQLKWPNDVYLRQRKLGGILVETTTVGQQPRLVVGIGLNINNSLHTAPAEIIARATSLTDALGGHFSLTEILLAILVQLTQVFSEMSDRGSQLLRDWRQLCLLTGRHVEIATGQRHIRGLCQGVDDQGALCIETDSGLERCYAGVVEKIL